jgi:hypothetical protein
VETNGEWIMAATQSVPELVAAAQANAKMQEGRIAETLVLMGGQHVSEAQIEDLSAATVALELAAVDILSVFEARMQHHFKRGPFSRKLKSILVQAGKTDLANRIHQYYLAINVLKHGTGASYRELLKSPSHLVAVKPAGDVTADEADAPASLIDVTLPGFFDGLTETILEAYRFLEKR